MQTPLTARLLSIPARDVEAAVPQEEHTLAGAESTWRRDFNHFVADGLPAIVETLVLAFVLQRVTLFFVRRLRRRADRLVAHSQKAAQLRTVAGILRATAYALLGFYVVVQVLEALGVPLGPFIASAGVIGLGISFGAQSIFKDMLTGLFILIENQYVVGDWVTLAGLSGAVEDLTLRTTTLRGGDGTLYIVPNSQITTVSNQSRDWSVATFSVNVDAAANPDRVLAVLEELARTVRADESFHDVLLADPSVLGVDKIDGRSVTYTMLLRVQANQRDGVLRALRKRVLECFEAEGIPLGIAGSMLLMKTDAAAPNAVPPGVTT